MGLFEIQERPRLPASRRYSLALGHQSGKVSGLGHAAKRLPARRKGDPPGDAFDQSRIKPSTDGPRLFIADDHAHKPASALGKNPITGDPVPINGRPNVAGLGDYRDESLATGAVARITAGRFGLADVAAVTRT